MNLLVKILPHSLPAFIREKILAQLLAATADAFACPAPSVDRLTYAGCLQAYAEFTRDQAEKALQSGQDIPSLKARLYQNALSLGGKLRRWLDVDTLEEVLEIGQILYQAIGVDMGGDARGDICVRNCYYSQFYSSQVCDLISALDDGVFSGLSGGARLVFSQRITEGRPVCRATLLGWKGKVQ